MGIATALMIGGSIAAGAVASQLMAPDVPEVSPPAMPDPGEADLEQRKRKKTTGRGQTIVTGDLTPSALGQKTLLGS
jgi:hypothetical protein